MGFLAALFHSLTDTSELPSGLYEEQVIFLQKTPYEVGVTADIPGPVLTSFPSRICPDLPCITTLLLTHASENWFM